ncbi:MAG: hypothetical protein A2X86_07635 [Bdellovibrionales bacterium GWA2_49_15]|nr:MAG: hypothetical protein A2X86_07635 [Bdellovibrionales bacterium GWA2_49_15]HAZ11850.1 hypothetical protein [Bdellovibrionales bacterium]
MDEKFQYLAATKGEFMVVSLVGAIDDAAEEQLSALYGEIEHQRPRFVVLNFHDVTLVERSAYRLLTMVQMLVRSELNGVIRSCGLKPKLRRLLEQEAILRQNEICDNVQIALNLFLQMRGKA